MCCSDPDNFPDLSDPKSFEKLRVCLLLGLTLRTVHSGGKLLKTMAIQVVEFSNRGYKIRKVLGRGVLG